MGKRLVKNYPSPRLMETIGATNQTAAEAIGELVANCFDARFEGAVLDITIRFEKKQISVVDNGKGMTSEVLEKAVCIAEDMSKYIERGEGAKGHFGMGFKTSCATLGNHYDIYTRPSNEVEFHTSFDIKEYGNRPSGADAWDVIIEDYKPTKNSPLGNLSHGTAFVISELKNKDILVSAVLDYLGEAFKAHIESGDKITIIDDTGEIYSPIPKHYNFVKGTRVEIDEVFGPGGRYHITGWVAIDSQTHNDGLYGFNIYRNKQLVLQFDKSWFRAHLMTSRIIGAVNMDFLDSTFYKQGIQESEDWKLVKSHMTEYLKPIVSASNYLSQKGNVNKPEEVKKTAKQLRDEYGVSSTEDVDFEETKPSRSGTKKQPSINDTIKTVVQEKVLILDGEEEIAITYLEKEDAGNMQIPFDYIFSSRDEGGLEELQVIVFKNHPLWMKKTDEEVKRILATSDAIYRLLVEKLDYDTPKALKIRNEWLIKRTETMKDK